MSLSCVIFPRFRLGRRSELSSTPPCHYHRVSAPEKKKGRKKKTRPRVATGFPARSPDRRWRGETVARSFRSLSPSRDSVSSADIKASDPPPCGSSLFPTRIAHNVPFLFFVLIKGKIPSSFTRRTCRNDKRQASPEELACRTRERRVSLIMSVSLILEDILSGSDNDGIITSAPLWKIMA